MLHSSPYAAQFPVRVLPWRAVWSSASACQTLHRPIPPFQPFIYRLAADSISSCCFRHRVFLCIRNVPLTILRFRVTLSLQSLSLLWLLVPGSPNITISVQALLLFSVTYVLYLNTGTVFFRQSRSRAQNFRKSDEKRGSSSVLLARRRCDHFFATLPMRKLPPLCSKAMSP